MKQQPTTAAMDAAIAIDHGLIARKSRVRWLSFLGALVVTLLAVLSAGVSEILWPWQSDPSITSTATVAAPLASLAAKSPAVAPVAPALPVVPTGTDSSVSESPQLLLLSGTMPGRNAREGVAFIGIHRDSPQTYVAGALLANGAQLTEIHRDHVVLSKDSQTVALYLQDAQPPAAASQPSQSLAPLLYVGGSAPSEPAVAISADTLTEYLRPAPVYDGELIKGYVVNPGTHASVFRALGLQPGDVITAMNGARFSSPEQAIDLFRQLASGIALVATIERKGQVSRTALDGQLIVADQERRRETLTMTGSSPAQRLMTGKNLRQ